MKITDIHVDGFGVWNDLSVDELSGGMTLFFGRNEAGKTTLMQFIRAVLYGFSPDRRKLYLPPVHGGIPGGLLRLENHSGQFVVERRLSERNEQSPGRLVVLASNGSRQGQHLLGVLLSGVDEPVFNNVFAVGIRELQELATLNDTQAAELLYNLASGVDRVSLVEVMRDLAAARQRLLRDDEQACEISLLLEQQRTLVAEIAEHETQTRHWCDLASERITLIDEVAQLEERISRLKHDARTMEIALQVFDKWLLRTELDAQLEECGHVEKLPDDCLSRLDELNGQIQQQKAGLQPIKQRRREIRRQLAAQPINQALWNEGPRIAAICEHGPWINSLDGEILRLRQAIDASEEELLRHEETLAAEGAVSLANSPVVSARTVQQLQPAALALRESSKKRLITRKQQKRHRLEEEQATNELKDELAGRQGEDLNVVLQRSGELVSQLRRRGKLEERLDQMWRQQEELEREHLELLDSQAERVRILIAIGAMFVFGAVLVLSGMFGWKVMPMSAEISWGVFFLGVVCVGLSCAWKVVLERTSQEELTTCISRRESLQREIEQAVDDRQELDRVLPAGTGTFASRLATAEREFKELEAMAPLHQERIEARRRTQETRRQGSRVDEDLRESRSRWRRALRQAGLPESLTPKHVRQLGAHHQKKGKIEESLRVRRERLTQLQTDRTALVDRLRQLHTDVGIQAVSDDPQIQISQLAAALAGQQEMVQRRKQLQREEKDIRRQEAAGLQSLRRLQRGREALFAEARVTDEAELRQRADQWARAAALRERRQTLSDQIAASLVSHCSQEEIAQELAGQSPQSLRERREDLVSRLRTSQTHVEQLHQRRGEINQETKTLAENRRLASAKFEVGCVREKIGQATRQWRILTMAWLLLENIRETYEAERQPETLEEASLFLNRLTDGKYTRVWTPLGRNELRVDDREGKPISLDVLSRGTREAVFLSLRLALVASYGRRGINIPMVLDDVLVNLDAQRAEAAVGALCDFARDGRQTLFFTCHDHIRQMFERVAVDVRILPVHGAPGTHVLPFVPNNALPAAESTAADELRASESFSATADTASESASPESTLPATAAAADSEDVASVPTDDRSAEDALIAEISTSPLADADNEPLPSDVVTVSSWDEPAEEEYALRDPAPRTAIAPAIDLEQLESDPPLAEEPPAAWHREEWQADEREALIDRDDDEECEEEPLDFLADVDDVFGQFDDEDDVEDGPWWDSSFRLRPREEETAA